MDMEGVVLSMWSADLVGVINHNKACDKRPFISYSAKSKWLPPFNILGYSPNILGYFENILGY